MFGIVFKFFKNFVGSLRRLAPWKVRLLFDLEVRQILYYIEQFVTVSFCYYFYDPVSFNVRGLNDNFNLIQLYMKIFNSIFYEDLQSFFWKLVSENVWRCL